MRPLSACAKCELPLTTAAARVCVCVSRVQKLGVRDIPAIEEVNLFHKDGHVIHFVNPKVQAAIASNTYVVSGPSESRKLEELLPGIITQLGPDNLADLKKIYQVTQEQHTTRQR